MRNITEGCNRFKKTGKRNEIFLATKFGITGDPQRPTNAEPEYVKACMEKSLSRLGGVSLNIIDSCTASDYDRSVDSVDLYYLHRQVPDTVICEEVIADVSYSVPIRRCLSRRPSAPWPSLSSTPTREWSWVLKLTLVLTEKERFDTLGFRSAQPRLSVVRMQCTRSLRSRSSTRSLLLTSRAQRQTFCGRLVSSA